MMDVSKLNELHSSFFREMQEVLDKFCDLEGLDKGESASDMLNQELTDYQLEFINAFNHPQFSPPTSNLTDPNFGQITNTLNAGRSIQIALKYSF